jgi:heme-degrading monooxygenase HmoA
MSVVIIAKLHVDPAKLEELFMSRKDVFQSVSERGKSAGAVHHQFLAGDGEVLIVDEWPTAEAFNAFFSSQPEIEGLMAEGGVQGPPEVSVYQVMESPDRF